MLTQAQTSEQIAAVAQQLEGTIYVAAHRESADGVLTACGIEFKGLARDFSTKRGAPVSMVGSYYLRPHPSFGIGYMLKMGIIDGLGSPAPTRPHHAFIRSTNGNAPKNPIRRDAETPGYALFIGGLDDDGIDIYRGIVESQSAVIGFNRKPGQQDVTLKLDLTVVETTLGADGKVVRRKSDEPVREFLECTSALFKQVKNDLK